MKHFIGINQLSLTQLLSLIDSAASFSKFSTTLLNYPSSIVNIFLEDSTRTKTSFELAQKKLGFNIIDFDPSASSLSKGESMMETFRTFEAMGLEFAIVRSSDPEVFEDIDELKSLKIVNAGNGTLEHPSQCLLDYLTIKKNRGRVQGLKITIIGDIKHSRVAKSHILAAEKLGNSIVFVGPESLQLNELPEHCSQACLEDALKDSDVIMPLRIQLERHENLHIKKEDYLSEFGLDLGKVSNLKKEAIILHPGPFNLDVEITREVVDHPQSRIYEQIKNGVYARMAILKYLQEFKR